MNCVMLELKIPYMVMREQSFLVYFEPISRNEMPQQSVVIWISTEYFFMRYISCWRYIDRRKSEGCLVERKIKD